MKMNKTKFGISALLGFFILIAFAMSASAAVITFSGNVTDSATGAGVVGATVNVYNSTTLLNTTLTIADGAYSLTAEDGISQMYTVEAVNAGYTTSSSGAVVGAVPPATITKNLLISIPGVTYALSGTVTDSATSLPIEGVTVTSRISGVTFETTTTDASGDYTLEVFDTETYDINFTDSDYFENTTSKTIPGANVNFDLVMDPKSNTGTLNGVVYDQFDDIVEGATVTFKRALVNNLTVDSTITADGTGAYTFDLPQDTYNIFVTATDHIGNVTENVVLARGDTVPNDIYITKTATISGTILPAATTTITFNQNGTQKYQITSAVNGSYSQAVIIGDYEIVVSRSSGYYPNTNSSVNVTADMDYTLTLTAIPPTASPSPGCSSCGGSSSFTGDDFSMQTSGASYSYSWQSLKPDVKTEMNFKSTELAVKKVAFELSSEAKQVEFNIKTAKAADMPSTPTNAQSYFEINAKNFNSIKYADIEFEVNSAWLSEKGIDASQIRLLRLVDGKWTELSTSKAGATADAVSFKATTPGFSYFAVAAVQTAAVKPSTGGNAVQVAANGTGSNVVISPNGGASNTPSNTGAVSPITGQAVAGTNSGKGTSSSPWIWIAIIVVVASIAAVLFKMSSAKKGGKKKLDIKVKNKEE